MHTITFKALRNHCYFGLIFIIISM